MLKLNRTWWNSYLYTVNKFEKPPSVKNTKEKKQCEPSHETGIAARKSSKHQVCAHGSCLGPKDTIVYYKILKTWWKFSGFAW